jgi:hypothetical protein
MTLKNLMKLTLLLLTTVYLVNALQSPPIWSPSSQFKVGTQTVINSTVGEVYPNSWVELNFSFTLDSGMVAPVVVALTKVRSKCVAIIGVNSTTGV